MSNIIHIKNFDDEALDVYARLSEQQLLHYYEPKEGLFIAESPKVIERALDASYYPVSMLIEDRHIETEAKEIISRLSDTPVYTADFDVLTRLTGYQLTRGALCLMRRKKPASVEELCRNARRIAIMDSVVNPTNVGAIFRNAAALGIDAVLLTHDCSDPLYKRACRVSMGTVFQIPWTKIPKNSINYMNILKALGFKTCAMALTDDSVRIDDAGLLSEEKLAIILGSEGYGLPADTIMSCDYTVKIPMSNHVDSLNVAAASAIAFWQLGNKNIF